MQLCDQAWLERLAASDAYRGIAVKVEYAKMCVWCEVHHKHPTRSRLINWLNKCERPMALPASRALASGQSKKAGLAAWTERARRQLKEVMS